jgi:hypothetical protein
MYSFKISWLLLCDNCNGYLQILYKKKRQREGGNYYQCTTPGKTALILGIPPKTPVAKRHGPVADSVLCDIISVLPPERKKSKY